MPSVPAVAQEHVFNAPDVCSSCFRLVREERDHVVPTNHVNRAGLDELPVGETSHNRTVVQQSYYGRTMDATAVAHPPTDRPTDSRRVFCECGVDGAFGRAWGEADVTRDRFRAFLKHLARSLERKRISVDRKALFAHAIAAFNARPDPVYLRRFASLRDEWTVNYCLGVGVEAGIVRAATADQARAAPSD